MKTTTNRNERRPAAPRPAAEVLRYEVQPVTNWLSRTGRRAVALHRPATHLRALPHFLDPSLSRVYITVVYTIHARTTRDYISLLDNATGRCVGTIKTNVILWRRGPNRVIVLLAHSRHRE